MKKKLLALLVALTLICSMFATVSVSAASDVTISASQMELTSECQYLPNEGWVQFGYNGIACIGTFDLSQYSKAIITYLVITSFDSDFGGIEHIMGLKNGPTSYGWDGSAVNMNGDLAHAPMQEAPAGAAAGSWNERTMTLDLSSVTYSGKVYVTSYVSNGTVQQVKSVKLIAKKDNVTPPPATYDAQININSINSNIWANNTTIIYEPSYSDTITSKWHNAIICTYSDEEGAYVVTTKWGELDDRSGVRIAPGQILIDSCGTGVTSNAEGWAAVQVGSLIYLNGVDLDAATVEAGAFAGIVNKDDVVIPNAPDLPDPPISEFDTSIDFTYIDGSRQQNSGAGGKATYTFPGSFDIETSIGFGGWAVVSNGVAKYQYSIDGENFYDITDATISERSDLAAAGKPYPDAHSTAGFTVKVPVTAFNNGTNELTIRLIDTQGGYCDILKATVNADNPGGAQIPDDDLDDDQNNNQNNNTNNNNNQGTNVPTDDSVAVVFVMLVAIVAMAAVVIKRRKENI